MNAPRVSAVVVSYNTRDDLQACLASLAGAGSDVEAIVVDNASADGSADLVERAFPRDLLIRNAANEGFARACNQGARAAHAPYLLFLNSDATVTADAVGLLARVLDDDEAVGIVGPRTLNEDGTPQVSCGPALTLVAEWRQRRLVRGVRRRNPRALREAARRSQQAADPDWVSGSCLMARRTVFERLGGFDEAFFLYEEDVDLCVRARAAGWRVRFEPRACVVHRLGRSMDQAADRARLEYHRSHLLYYRKHNGAAATALLRAGLGLRALLGWLRSALRVDASGRAAHGRLLHLAFRGN